MAWYRVLETKEAGPLRQFVVEITTPPLMTVELLAVPHDPRDVDVVVQSPVWVAERISEWCSIGGIEGDNDVTRNMENTLQTLQTQLRSFMIKLASKQCGVHNLHDMWKHVGVGYLVQILHNPTRRVVDVKAFLDLEERGENYDRNGAYVRFTLIDTKCQSEIVDDQPRNYVSIVDLNGSSALDAPVTSNPETWVSAFVQTRAQLRARMAELSV